MLKDKQILEFTRGLHVMVRSGIGISEALNLLQYEVKGRSLRRVVNDLSLSIEEGATLVFAFENTKKFPSLFVQMLSIAQNTGEMEEVLTKLLNYYEKRVELKRNILGKAIYPSIVLLFIMIICIAFNSFLLPLYESINVSMGASMPSVTLVFIKICYFLKNYLVVMILTIGALSLLVRKLFKRKKTIRLIVDKVLLRIPLVRKFIFYANINVLLYSLYLLISSGISVLYAIEVSSNCIKNMEFKRILGEISKDVTNGQSISGSIKKYKLPHKLTYMISTGEYTGQLEQNIKRLQEIYEGEAHILQSYGEKIIEPATTVFLGVIVVFVLVAIIKPAYSVLSSIK